MTHVTNQQARKKYFTQELICTIVGILILLSKLSLLFLGKIGALAKKIKQKTHKNTQKHKVFRGKKSNKRRCVHAIFLPFSPFYSSREF
jgi:hypothetical protein